MKSSSTGSISVFLDTIDHPKVIDFTADGLHMYVGTNSSDGDVFRVELDGLEIRLRTSWRALGRDEHPGDLRREVPDLIE